MANAIFPAGIRCFKKGDNSPDFVMANIIISPRELFDWLKGDGAQYLTTYNEKKQLKLTLMNGENGPYVKVDTFVPKKKDPTPDPSSKPKVDLPPDFDPIQNPAAGKQNIEPSDDLPF